MSPLPLVDILDVITNEVEKRKLRRVAALGARETMETRLFGSLTGHADVGAPHFRAVLLSGTAVTCHRTPGCHFLHVGRWQVREPSRTAKDEQHEECFGSNPLSHHAGSTWSPGTTRP